MNLPQKVEIIDVCPRDGFQNVKDFIETDNKIRIIKKLIDAGFKRIEATSFVNPRWIPQMQDANEVIKEIKNYVSGRDVTLVALVPNKIGFDAAREAGVDEVTFVISVSEAHNKRNVNKTVAESLVQFEEIIKDKGEVKVKLALATTFGCPFGENIKVDKILYLAEKALNLGASEILLADTVGLGNPLLIHNVLEKVTKEIEPDKICMHLHDTRGLGLANTLVAMNHGIYQFESATGGLGGCPFAPGASGNVATEDLLNMLNSMEIETGIQRGVLAEAIDLIKKYVNAPIVSHMSKL